VLKILVIYSTFTTKSNWLDSLYSFKRYTNFKVYYFNARLFSYPRFFENIKFDIIIYHTLFFNQRWDQSELIKTFKRVEVIKNVKAIKVVMPQDEFINSNIVNEFIKHHEIDLILSPQPPEEWVNIYNSINKDKVKFFSILTGYIDEKRLRNYSLNKLKSDSRRIDIGYRTAGKSPYWFGRHGYLKEKIAIEFSKKSSKYLLKTDINTGYLSSISGENWYKFLASCRYTIGVEGGTSIIDPTGTIKQKTEEYCRKYPMATFEEVESACFPNLDGKFKGFALSPRHLEACMTGTCQILIEGNYNGILKPNIHYIPLKSNFSNIDSVLNSLADDKLRERIVDNCYKDIVVSEKYTYRAFVNDFMSLILKEYNINREEKKVNFKEYLVNCILILLDEFNKVLAFLNQSILFKIKKLVNKHE
jgi:hypothetical protein